ncbi:MAG: restriction endonuclease subunit S [Hydrogenoanaerobacterium sp.]
MKAQSLKNAILQLAVQGKLAAQNPQDEPASELLKKIKAEKAKLIKGNKIKTEKPLAPITDEEKPFDIPTSWEWARLGELCHKLTDGTHSTPKYIEKGVPFLSVKDMSSGKLDFSNTRHISEEEHQELYKRCNAEKGDLLLTKVGTTGVPVIVDTDKQFSLFVSVALLKMNWSLNNAEFLCLWIQSPLVYQQAQKNTKGVGNQNWVMRDIGNTVIPIPPLAEQQRIVKKIEQLMPLVEQYDSYEKELSALEAKFPNDLKKAVLQFAVQGKLVPQNNADEPASQLLKKIKAEKAKLIKEKKSRAEKPLAQITDEEKPFDIPDSWEWVRLGEIGIAQTGNTPSTNDKENYGNEYPFVSPGDMTNSEIKYINRLSSKGYSKSRIIEENSVIMVCIGGSIGKCNIIDRDIVCNQQINTITPFAIAPKYLLYALRANYFFNFMKKIYGGTATPIVNKSVWCSITIPLPPLAEQQRIVEKVEQILALCDALADENKLKEHQAPKRLAKVIEFTPVETTEEHEHLFAARADEVSLETRTKELERLALLRKKK